MMIFGMFRYGFAHSRRRPTEGPWGWRPRPERKRAEGPSPQEQFERWHNLEHAREEVDSWVEDDI